MDGPENKMSTDHGKKVLNPFAVKKPKKRSIVERELETNLTARFTSPVTGDGVSTSRYGRARRSKTDHEFEHNVSDTLKSPLSENTLLKVQSPIFKQALKSPFKVETPKRALETSRDNIDYIYQENKALSRFNDNSQPRSSSKKSKVYIQKDLTNRDDDDDVILIKDLFSPTKSGSKYKCSNLNSTEKYNTFMVQNGHIDNSSVVKTLDFDGNKRKENKDAKSKNELFHFEAQSPYQVGDLVWARMGTFPFWPCIITKDPANEQFVKKKLFGRVEHDILHVTFFADNGRHNWVVDNMLRNYMGPEEFASAREKFTPEEKKKDPRLYAAFFISEKKQGLWNSSVEEAELIRREPKRLRIDVFNDILYKARISKKQQKSGKLTRTDSDVSLSESLYDSLFSEDDSKTEESKCSRNRQKNPKIDVSDVVTACLDNMAAKTGNSKIQRQSHMDRWLQKAKSKTPEKVKTDQTLKTPLVTPKIEAVTEKVTPKVEKVTPNVDKTSNRNKRKRLPTKPSAPVTKVYSLRRSYEAQSLQSNEKSEQGLSQEKMEHNTFDSAKNVSKDESVHVTDENNTVGVPESADSTDCCIIITKDVPVIDLVSKEIVPLKNATDKMSSENCVKVDNIIDDLITDTEETDEPTKSIEESAVRTKTDHLIETKTQEYNKKIESLKSTTNLVFNVEAKAQNFDKTISDTEKNFAKSIKSLEGNKNDVVDAINEILGDTNHTAARTAIAVVEPFLVINDPDLPKTVKTTESKKDDKSEEKNHDESEEMDVDDKESRSVSMSRKTISNRSVDIDEGVQSIDGEVNTTVRKEIVKTPDKSLKDNAVEKKSPLKVNEMVSIPDFNDDDSNIDFLDLNTCDSTDLEGQVKPKNYIVDVKNTNKNDIVEDTDINKNDKRTIDAKMNEDNEKMSIDDDDLTDISMDEKCGVLNESGNSESILQIVADLNEIINEEPEIKDTSNTEQDVLKMDKNDPKKRLELKSIEVKQSNEPKSFLGEALSIDPVAKNLATVNKVNFFREVSVDKPPDLISKNLAAKAELLKDIQDELSGDEADLKPDSLAAKTELLIIIQKEKSVVKSDLNPDTLAAKTELLKDIQCDTNLDKSTDLKPDSIVDSKSLKKIQDQKVVEEPAALKPDSLAVKADLPKDIQVEDEPTHSKPDNLEAKVELPKDVQNASDFEAEDSDDEPSPEYEPLGDDITEDFRQHLKCIESNITDKKDDAQLVKVCEEIAIIEESKHKLADLKVNISLNTSLSDKSPIKSALSPLKVEKVSESVEHVKSTNVIKEKPNEIRNHGVKIEPYNIELTNEVKDVGKNFDSNKRKEKINGLTIMNSLKSPGSTKSLSLKKSSPRTLTVKDSVVNDRYKTIDQIEEIISSKREPKRLPIENGEVNIPEIKENGYCKRDDTPDLNDDDFDIDDVSMNSEDSDISLPNKHIKPEPDVPRRSLRSRPEKKGGLQNPEFLAYYEMNVDNLMDEYPELSQDDLLLYCYQTFLYKENLKADVKQIEESLNSSIKGVTVKQETPSRKKSKKPQSQPKNTLENFFREKYKNAKKIDFDSEVALPSERSDSIDDVKPKIETLSVSPVDPGIENGKDSNEDTPTVKGKTKSPEQIEVNKEVKTELIKDAMPLESEPTPSSPKTPKRVRTKTTSPRVLVKSDKRVPVVVISPIKNEKAERDETESVDSDSDLPLRQLRSRVTQANNLNELKRPEETPEPSVKDEVEETASVSSDNLPLLRLKPIACKIEVSNEDPEFLKYVELKMDAIMDENPQLSLTEIHDYLRKVYIYEKNSKSEIQKIEEIESSNLVKGLNQETQPPKKARRKPKVEKTPDVEEIIPKEKPKRKTVQHYYNEAFLSDIEDELEVFEIFKTKKAPITVVSKTEVSPKKESAPETKTEELGTETIEEISEEVNTLNEIELYFKQLITPKPSVFIGLIREKVCEICEDISNLIKCKGCNGMFHYDCVNKETVKEVETPVTRGRKKKKVGRKRKSQENENSDVSEENVSIDDIVSETFTFDAANLEAQIEAKMKELLEKDKELHYDSYSSDDGIDWTDTIPGKCEIIDVKLKPRSPPIDHANFKCNNCQKHSTPVCFVCKAAISKSGAKIRQKCNVQHCFAYYHVECLDHWPQTQFNAGELSKIKKEQHEALTCPRHVCHTCVSDDPRGCKTRFSTDKLAKCVRCPATYHSFNKCLPAGTQILTASFIICPRHYDNRPGKVPCHVNTGWCFICALGGSLICCEYCPTSFHAECLNIEPPDGNYMCEDCETGRLPLYGEMVWVKLGHYRWWPGVILHPSEIPDNIMAVKHGLGEFVVRFFGQYDHYWVNRGRVFPYQEGDSGRVSGQKSKIDADFTTAMEHAQRAFEILKNAEPDEEEESDIAASLLPPHYIKLKSNKPIGSLCGRKIEDPSLSLTQCECNPADIEPCGANSQCLNRVLLTECGPTCRAGERCNNRAFEKRLYPKLAPYKAPHRGWGLKTLEAIKAGTFVIEYVGELIDEEEFQRRMRRKHEIRDENFYFLTLDKERMIDAGPKGNLARFMNHCCEPNCETQKWTVLGDIRVGLFAIDDIPANSEVTFNYNLECTGIEKKRCLCGAQRCSGYIGAKPKQDESQRKKNGMKRVYKKRKNIGESPSTSKNKSKRLGRPPKSKEMSEIEKDLLIIKNASPVNSESPKTQNEENNTEKAKLDSIATDNTVQNGPKLESEVINSSTNETINIDDKSPKLRMKIKIGPNTSEVVSMTNDNDKVNFKKKIDLNEEVISNENSDCKKSLKRKIDSILTGESSNSSGEPSSKKKCDRIEVGD